jgi:signal transduction histidine kinase
MMRIKSIVLKLLITYIAILFVSHVVLTLALYILFQNNLTNMPLNSGNLTQLRSLFALASLISIIIPGLFTYSLSQRITAPLREMNRVALQIARGEFDQRVEIKTRDEVGALGETFNYMAAELAGLDQMRKDFVANVSHDLRSPLTSIHGFVRAFLDEAIPKRTQTPLFDDHGRTNRAYDKAGQ